MRRSHSCAKPSITVYRPAWTLASRTTLISNRLHGDPRFDAVVAHAKERAAAAAKKQ
jgi:hypothetical protein